MKTEQDYIIESKRRCKAYGIDPNAHPTFSTFLTEEELNKKRKQYEEILTVIDEFVRKLFRFVEGFPLLILTTDENGYVLEMAGDEAMRTIVNQSGIRVGIGYSERDAGTNSVNLALDLLRPVEVIGSNHYHNFLTDSACYSVPFQYLDDQKVLGTITIMTTADQHNSFLLPLLSTVVDSIERELLLKKQNRKLHILNQVVIDTTRNGIIITDKDGKITEFNRSAEWITGDLKNDLIGTTYDHFKYANILKEVICSEKEFANLEFTFEREGKDPVICLADAFPIRDEDCALIGGFVQFRDITERYQAEKKINYLAYHDELTGLPNRRSFKQFLTQVLERSTADQKKFAVMFLDLDRFKVINDNLGHNQGDVVLTMVADRLQSVVSSEDMVARLGGDEFTILLQSFEQEVEARALAERLIQKFEKPFRINGYDLFVTASIGMAFYPRDGENTETLMKHADIAMYRAKEQGKNNFAVYSPAQNDGMEQLTLENSLRMALQNEEFELYYQPQMDTTNGRMIGAEALLRWHHPVDGIISPNVFIPIAEELGLIVPIGEWVLRQACQQLRAWEEYDPNFKVSVNLSARQFSKQDLVEKINAITQEAEIAPENLVLEITESMTMDVEHAKEIIGRLKALGFKVSIDDFGTGYSNLYYLKKFSVDHLKIDQSFIRDIGVDHNAADIVATMIRMADSLGINVIAEGVETEEQLAFLNRRDCYYAQGYLFYRPLPADELTALIIKNDRKGERQ